LFILSLVACNSSKPDNKDPKGSTNDPPKAQTPKAPPDEATVTSKLKGFGSGVIRDEKQPGKPVRSIFIQSFPIDSFKEGILKDLAVYKELKELSLNRTKVTDAGLKDLAALKTLTSLELDRVGITDAGLKELTALDKLETLDLTGNEIMGPGLKDLVALKELKRLNLQQTPITDAGLKNLEGLKTLKNLVVSNTKVTPAGVAELKKVLPMCNIQND